MGNYTVQVDKDAEKDIKKIFKSGNKNDIKRFEKIYQELETNPREGIGNPERLKYFNEEYWSRELNKKDRVVYKIIENEIIVILVSALGHYNDK